MKKITVLSGKGGVGKSSITASLAVLLSEKHKVICADCDMDASNLALVLGQREEDFLEWKPVSTNQKAKLLPKKCNGCGKCIEKCYFNAIEWKKENRPKFNPFLCEGCGVCEMLCPNNAIELVRVENAKIGYGRTKFGFEVVSGQLKMGESGSGKVVSLVKKLAEERGKNVDFMLIDSAAGIGCPVIASVAGSDFVIAVTESTPSGISDLKRALGVVNQFSIPYGIVVNKHDLNLRLTKEIKVFVEEHGAMVLARIPYDKSFVEALVNLKPVIEFNPKTRKLFEEIMQKIIGG